MLNKRNLIVLTIFSMYYSFLIMNQWIFIFYSITSGVLLYMEKNYIYQIIKKNKMSIYMLFIYVIVFSMPFIMLTNFSTPIYLLLTIWSILLAIVFFKNNNLYDVFRSIKYLLYSYIIIVLIYLYVTHGKYPQGYHLEYMLGDKVSANGVTSFLNILLGVYSAFNFKLNKKNTLILSLIVLYISIEGYARGSIIFSLVMIGINILFILFNSNKLKKLLFIFLLIMVIAKISPLAYDIYNSTKLSSGFESPRITMLNQYLNKLNSYSLLFGSSYDNTIIESEYHNNPHITYIRTHHIFGLFYLLSLLYVIAQQFFYLFKRGEINDWLIFLVVLNILMRTITEPLFFPSLFDSLFLVTLFLISKTITITSITRSRNT